MNETFGPQSRRFSDAFAEFVSDVDLAALEIDPDEVFAGVRDDAPGRDLPNIAPRN